MRKGMWQVPRAITCNGKLGTNEDVQTYLIFALPGRCRGVGLKSAFGTRSHSPWREIAHCEACCALEILHKVIRGPSSTLMANIHDVNHVVRVMSGNQQEALRSQMDCLQPKLVWCTLYQGATHPRIPVKSASNWLSCLYQDMDKCFSLWHLQFSCPGTPTDLESFRNYWCGRCPQPKHKHLQQKQIPQAATFLLNFFFDTSCQRTELKCCKNIAQFRIPGQENKKCWQRWTNVLHQPCFDYFLEPFLGVRWLGLSWCSSEIVDQLSIFHVFSSTDTDF